MKRRKRIGIILLLCVLVTVGYSIIRSDKLESVLNAIAGNSGGNSEIVQKPAEGDAPAEAAEPSEPTAKPVKTEDGIVVVAEPDSVTALVNPANKLPENYNPADLVYPDVRFVFDEKIEKRMMRQEAAGALEEMFEAASEDGMYLAGVSAYRSHATQKSLFERYVEKDGLEKAKTYSAFPGTSEHETGLAVDVTVSDGSCAVELCFGDTPEYEWLDKHAAEYGFIIRYPEGKESITTYQFEPWHLRYVGKELALRLEESGETLEEHYDAVPVSK